MMVGFVLRVRTTKAAPRAVTDHVKSVASSACTGYDKEKRLFKDHRLAFVRMLQPMRKPRAGFRKTGRKKLPEAVKRPRLGAGQHGQQNVLMPPDGGRLAQSGMINP